ncbi:MAG: 2-amino-4-hydroxy-6-hydroxymethyldihydropteridine diphosphokinase [Dehalococcoidia bacterium]|nr:2-amino-4-hydroxy-6-hydroxymethyldihydropteridine diphosphokinase [Dehalococcoidia bacterium]
MPTAYLCLGSNLGDREKNLIRALSLLSTEVNLDKASSIYETEPVGYKEQPFFLNLACQVTTNLNPWELLHLAKTIENKMGRIPSKQINAPRPIDIDILFYNKQIINSKNLTVPHPRLAKRAFVLIPLSEIAAELIHPQLGKSIAALVNNVRGQSGVRKYN